MSRAEAYTEQNLLRGRLKPAHTLPATGLHDKHELRLDCVTQIRSFHQKSGKLKAL